jgi:hypothetical protein
MKRSSWILGATMALTLAACNSGNRDAGAGGAGTETGSPGMSSDTAPVGAMDTAMTDTTATTDTGADTTSP